MIDLTIEEITRSAGGEWLGDPALLSARPADVVTDSRDAGRGSLFIAIRGERTDAAQLGDVIFSDLTHDFLQLSGRHKVIKVHLVLVRRAHHKMLSLHEKKPLEFFIYVLIHDCHPR